MRSKKSFTLQRSSQLERKDESLLGMLRRLSWRWPLATVVGFYIYEQADTTKNLAEHVGFFHAGFVSLAGSTVIGGLIALALLFASGTLASLRHWLPWYTPYWTYKLHFWTLLRKMTKPGMRRWWLVGVPGGVFVPMVSYAITLIGPLLTVASSLAGWAVYAAWNVRGESREAQRSAWIGLFMTFVGVGFSVWAGNVGQAIYSSDTLHYWSAVVMFGLGAGIMWQLTTLGKMGAGSESSRLAAPLVSWMGGALTIGGCIFIAWLVGDTPLVIPLNEFPSYETDWKLYLSMVYGVGIITISAITSRKLGVVKFVVAVATGYAVDSFYHSLVPGVPSQVVMLGLLSCVAVIAGVGVTLRSKPKPAEPTAMEKAA